jgi:hypothetical protein
MRQTAIGATLGFAIAAAVFTLAAPQAAGTGTHAVARQTVRLEVVGAVEVAPAQEPGTPPVANLPPGFLPKITAGAAAGTGLSTEVDLSPDVWKRGLVEPAARITVTDL